MSPDDIPLEVRAAAELVGRFFAERGIEVFELGPVRNRWAPIPPCRRGLKCECFNDCRDDPKLPQPLCHRDTAAPPL